GVAAEVVEGVEAAALAPGVVARLERDGVIDLDHVHHRREIVGHLARVLLAVGDGPLAPLEAVLAHLDRGRALVDQTAAEVAVAALEEAGDGPLAHEADAGPGRDLVLLHEGDDLLDALALRDGLDEEALGRQRAGAEVDDPDEADTSVEEQAQ